MNDESFKISRKEIKIRKDFGNVSPETKIEKVKTDYKRSDNRSEILKALEQEALDNDGSDLDWLP